MCAPDPVLPLRVVTVTHDAGDIFVHASDLLPLIDPGLEASVSYSSRLRI